MILGVLWLFSLVSAQFDFSSCDQTSATFSQRLSPSAKPQLLGTLPKYAFGLVITLTTVGTGEADIVIIDPSVSSVACNGATVLFTPILYYCAQKFCNEGICSGYSSNGLPAPPLSQSCSGLCARNYQGMSMSYTGYDSSPQKVTFFNALTRDIWFYVLASSNVTVHVQYSYLSLQTPCCLGTGCCSGYFKNHPPSQTALFQQLEVGTIPAGVFDINISIIDLECTFSQCPTSTHDVDVFVFDNATTCQLLTGSMSRKKISGGASTKSTSQQDPCDQSFASLATPSSTLYRGLILEYSGFNGKYNTDPSCYCYKGDETVTIYGKLPISLYMTALYVVYTLAEVYYTYRLLGRVDNFCSAHVTYAICLSDSSCYWRLGACVDWRHMMRVDCERMSDIALGNCFQCFENHDPFYTSNLGPFLTTTGVTNDGTVVGCPVDVDPPNIVLTIPQMQTVRNVTLECGYTAMDAQIACFEAVDVASCLRPLCSDSLDDCVASLGNLLWQCPPVFNYRPSLCMKQLIRNGVAPRTNGIRCDLLSGANLTACTICNTMVPFDQSRIDLCMACTQLPTQTAIIQCQLQLTVGKNCDKFTGTSQRSACLGCTSSLGTCITTILNLTEVFSRCFPYLNNLTSSLASNNGSPIDNFVLCLMQPTVPGVYESNVCKWTNSMIECVSLYLQIWSQLCLIPSPNHICSNKTSASCAGNAACVANISAVVDSNLKPPSVGLCGLVDDSSASACATCLASPHPETCIVQYMMNYFCTRVPSAQENVCLQCTANGTVEAQVTCMATMVSEAFVACLFKADLVQTSTCLASICGQSTAAGCADEYTGWLKACPPTWVGLLNLTDSTNTISLASFNCMLNYFTGPARVIWSVFGQ